MTENYDIPSRMATYPNGPAIVETPYEPRSSDSSSTKDVAKDQAATDAVGPVNAEGTSATQDVKDQSLDAKQAVQESRN